MDELTLLLQRLRRVPAGPLIAVAAVVGLWFMSSAPDALARVPDLEGLPLESARVQADAAGYHPRILLRDGPGRAGTVLRQHPPPTAILARGGSIDLHVTRGAKQVGIPDVRGMPVDEAQRLLRQSQLSPGDVTYRTVPGGEPNRVIATDPPAGATVDAGSTIHVIAAA